MLKWVQGHSNQRFAQTQLAAPEFRVFTINVCCYSGEKEEGLPSFHDTNMQILLLLDIREVPVDLVTLLAVVAM